MVDWGIRERAAKLALCSNVGFFVPSLQYSITPVLHSFMELF